MIYIIAYDIADNKRRLRVAKTLESWGYRIQESVFQLRLDSATLARVRLLLAALISDSEDVIHIYPICSSCADHADILGAAIAWTMRDCAGECGEGLADVLNRFRDANRFTRGWIAFRGEQLCGFQCSSVFGVPVIEVRRVVLTVLITRHVSHWDAVCVAKRCPLECLNPRELVETIGYLIMVDRADRLCPQTPVELSVASS